MHRKYGNLQKKINNIEMCKNKYLMTMIKLYKVYSENKECFGARELLIMFLVDQKVDEILKENTKNTSHSIVEYLQILDAESQNLIATFFLDLIRFELLLKIIAEEYFKQIRIYKCRDMCIIMVFLYIMIFQASILLGENIENSFKYLQASKILQLLSFLQLSSTFQFLTISACSIFDETFVRDKISKPFLDNLPTLKVITAHLQQHINARNYLRKTTKPIFMNVLHRSKKLPCIPSSTQKEINVKISATKLPNSTYNRPNEEQKLTVLRHENKLRAFQLLNNATKNAPTCLQRLKKFPKKNNLNEKKCYRKRITRLPMISEIEVEETTASILRRYTRVMKDKAKLIKKLQMLSEGGLDESAIEMLNQKEKMEKIKREKKIIQEKHLSALLSRKKASLAKQESLKKVKERADLTRKESKELCERFRKVKIETNQKNSFLVKRSKESHNYFNSILRGITI